MNTEGTDRKRMSEKICLNSSEIINLKKPNTGSSVEILVKSGIIRIGAYLKNNKLDLTLAFACRTESCRFIYPKDMVIRVESITDATFSISSYNQTESNEQDTIMDWIIQLHIIRNEANPEKRLIKLFKLLTTRLGKRTSEGQLLEHTLAHPRIAEIVGSTRSTVSRKISKLRKNNQIYIDEVKNLIIIPVD